MNHLWQSTLFTIAAGLLALMLRNTRAAIRYGLWFAASLKFLLPFAVLVTIGSDIPWRKPPLSESIPTAAAPLRVIGYVGRPFPPLPAPNPYAPLTSAAALSVVWAFGFALVIFAWVRRWLKVRSILQASSPLPLNLPIPVMSSSAGLEPGVCGIVRPVLLVPNGILDRLTPAQWNAIVAHELCHVRRRDNLTAAVHMVVEAIFWFHPLVWWIGKRMLAERERACDEAVLLGVHHPQDYAEGILSVCKLYAGLPLPCVSGIAGSNLKKRIRAIMAEPVAADLPVIRKFALALAGIAALTIPLGIGILIAPSIHAQSPPAPQLPPIPTPIAPPPAPRILAQTPSSPAASTAGPAQPVNSTVIGPNDELSIAVFRSGGFTRVYPVNSDGTVVLPLVGPIKAEGLTTLEFQQKLKVALTQFILEPEVTVSFQTPQKTYAVVGTVQDPGVYALSKPTTVVDAIRDAGGFVDSAFHHYDVFVARGPQLFQFNYDDYLKSENPKTNITLQDRDTVTVK